METTYTRSLKFGDVQPVYISSMNTNTKWVSIDNRKKEAKSPHIATEKSRRPLQLIKNNSSKSNSKTKKSSLSKQKEQLEIENASLKKNVETLKRQCQSLTTQVNELTEGVPRAFRFTLVPKRSHDADAAASYARRWGKYTGLYILKLCKFTPVWKMAEVGLLPMWNFCILFNQEKSRWELHENTIPATSITKMHLFLKTENIPSRDCWRVADFENTIYGSKHGITFKLEPIDKTAT